MQRFCGLLAMLALETVIRGYGMGGICVRRWGARSGVSGMRACARPGQRASSPAVSDVTVHLCVSGVWSKSITETKKPNATNHVHNSSLFPSPSFSNPLSLSLHHPEAPYQSINVLIQVRGWNIASPLHIHPPC